MGKGRIRSATKPVVNLPFFFFFLLSYIHGPGFNAARNPYWCRQREVQEKAFNSDLKSRKGVSALAAETQKCLKLWRKGTVLWNQRSYDPKTVGLTQIALFLSFLPSTGPRHGHSHRKCEGEYSTWNSSFLDRGPKEEPKGTTKSLLRPWKGRRLGKWPYKLYELLSSAWAVQTSS